MTSTKEIIESIQLSTISDNAYTLANDFFIAAIDNNLISPMWVAEFMLRRATDGKTIDKATLLRVMKDIIKLARDNKNEVHDELCSTFVSVQQN